ncbi:MAG: arginine--tRNA ligase [Acidimicrobiia bacterium]
MRIQLQAAIEAALSLRGWEAPGEIVIEASKQREHGDFACSIALQLTKALGRSPRDIAAELILDLNAQEVPFLATCEIAGPGFINFRLQPEWFTSVIPTILDAPGTFGHSETLAGEQINLEFVSANPTGPLHAGGGRWVAVGDALANLLATQGASVEREYYLNDAGTQLALFAASLFARLHGEPLPDDGYAGEYLIDMAEAARAEGLSEVDQATLGEWGYHRVVDSLRDDLSRIGVEFDTWFSERVLHERGDVHAVIEDLRERGVLEEREGATWLRTTEFGDTRDRVLIRSDGTTTYLCNDLAYHRDKFRRGATHCIDIWGADHHGQIASVQAGLRALGVWGEPNTPQSAEPEIILGQFVKLMRDGQEVRISKRAGNVITLADILDEVDPDVARLTFLLQSIDTAQTFDLAIVTEQSMENPVYYVQYAHARMASIERKAREVGYSPPPLPAVDLNALTGEREMELLRVLHEYPEVLAIAAERRAPHRVTTWVRECASRFHGFYADCRVVDETQPELSAARYWLVAATRSAIANALGVLGVSAPDRMDHIHDGESPEIEDAP